MNLNHYFHTLTKHPPRQFQLQTIAHLLNRQNILLRAPTGSGKTETAIAPFLFAKTLQLDFPNKLIYVVPLRTLANSLRQRTEKLVKDWSAVYQSSRPLAVTLQTGENPEDRLFEGDIIFCTIDQMLSSFLNIPYSVGRGSANVNTGAIFASYLVFDELHLLDPDRSFTTVLKVLQEVKGISPCLLMTATLTEQLVEKIKQEIDSDNIEDQSQKLQLIRVENSNDLESIEGSRDRTFEAKPKSEFLTSESIVKDIQDNCRKRVIVLCNTVAKAQGLYQDLERERQTKNLALNLVLLHSRFLSEHRSAKEKSLQDKFAHDWKTKDDGKCQVLISTQVIEAGINITCEVMHTEICPMNSLLQRAGRCARFKDEMGKVYVYWDVKVSQNSNDRTNFKPYTKEICEETWTILEERSPEEMNQKVGFSIEQNWIDQVHTKQDIKQLQQRSDNRMEFEKFFDAAMRKGDESARRWLIRDIDSCNILIVRQASQQNIEPILPSDGESVDFSQLLPFSLPTLSLYKAYQDIQREFNPDWILMNIEISQYQAETYRQPVYKVIESIKAPPELKYYSQLVINPEYVDYSPEIGLRLGLRNGKLPAPTQTKSPVTVSEYKYYMDIYEGHLIRLWAYWRKPFPSRPLTLCDRPIYLSVRDELLKPGGRYLKERIFSNIDQQKAEDLFEYLVFFAIFTHDLGKLQTRWQEVMRGWQKIVHNDFKNQSRRSDPKSYLLAHTDYEPSDKTQKERMKEYDKRPPHAVEGAFLAGDLLQQFLEPLLRQHYNANDKQVEGILWTVILAAGRHHYAWAKGEKLAKEIRLHKDARKAIKASLRCMVKVLPNTLPMRDRLKTLKLSVEKKSKSGELIYDTAGFELNNFRETQIKYHYLYLLVVRALRLCDRRSVQWESPNTRRDTEA